MEQISGRVIKSSGGLYEIETAEDIVPCKARGRFRYENLKLLVGDLVLLRRDDHGNSFVSEIMPRKNTLIRPPLSNLDILFAVIAAAKPDPVSITFDKLISIAEYNKIEPVVIVTKSDIDPESADKICETYRKCGFLTFNTSSVNGDGTEELKRFISQNTQNKICAFSGVSGVGKSTLINALYPELNLQTNTISGHTERGRNTTRTVQLFHTSGGGYLADTPGFSLLDFENFDFYTLEDLPYEFREFVPLLGKCKYSNCTHRKEQGCELIAQVKSGLIPVTRHESYLSIYDELKDKHEWTNK